MNIHLFQKERITSVKILQTVNLLHKEMVKEGIIRKSNNDSSQCLHIRVRYHFCPIIKIHQFVNPHAIIKSWRRGTRKEKSHKVRNGKNRKNDRYGASTWIK